MWILWVHRLPGSSFRHGSPPLHRTAMPVLSIAHGDKIVAASNPTVATSCSLDTLGGRFNSSRADHSGSCDLPVLDASPEVLPPTPWPAVRAAVSADGWRFSPRR